MSFLSYFLQLIKSFIILSKLDSLLIVLLLNLASVFMSINIFLSVSGISSMFPTDKSM